MAQRSVTATEFKAKCLALLDDVSKNGGTILVTKRGKPLATVAPPPKTAWKSSEGSLRGKLGLSDDELDALLMRDTSDDWECVREAEAAQRRRRR